MAEALSSTDIPQNPLSLYSGPFLFTHGGGRGLRSSG